MLRRLGLVIFLLLVFAIRLPVPSVQAQGGGECSVLVDSALAALDTNCANTGRNEICYGNRLLTTEFWGEVAPDVFAKPADLVNAIDVRTITGAPLIVEREEWGLALLRLQADLPDTLPGENVTVVLVGDVALENAVSPEDARQPVTPIDVTATTAANLRGGPGTNFGVVGSVPSGTVLPAIGRTEAGDWVQVVLEEQIAWVSTQLVSADGDLSTLPIAAGEAVSYGPMQAFYFNTGLSNVDCPEAPPDHLLVRSPENLTVSFFANGARFTIGSMTALRTREGVMTATTFDGTVIVEAEGSRLTIPPGFEIDVPLGGENGLTAAGAPRNLRVFDRDEWAAYDAFSQDMEVVGAFDVPDEPPPPPDPGQLATSGGEVAPSGVALGTGDVQVTLAWDSVADMDLSVIDPNGERVYFANRQSSTGGQLDVDSNFPCGQNLFYVENVFWPTGRAPSGTYRVGVDVFSTCGGPQPNWTLTVRVGGQVALTQSGQGDNSFSFTR